jgi:hypothetical protein
LQSFLIDLRRQLKFNGPQVLEEISNQACSRECEKEALGCVAAPVQEDRVWEEVSHVCEV